MSVTARSDHHATVTGRGVKHAATTNPADQCFGLQTVVEAGLLFSDDPQSATTESRGRLNSHAAGFDSARSLSL